MTWSYKFVSWCVTCRLINPIIRLRCEQCNRLVRHKNGIRNHTDKHRDFKRYGIAFIPTAIIVVSSLYNIVFI